MKFRIYESLPPRHGNLTNHPINPRTGKCFMQMQWELVPGSREDYLARKAKGLHLYYTGY